MKTSIKNKRRRRWSFTVNNFTEDDITHIKSILKPDLYGFGVEGKDKTRHLQGWIEWKNAKSMNATKKRICDSMHLEASRGNREKNITYCSKEDDYYSNYVGRKEIKDYYLDYEPKDWQLEILDIIKGPVNTRTVYWYYENKGNVGKSVFTRHMLLKHDALVIGGCSRDIKSAIGDWIIEKDLSVILIDIPRSAFSKISYKTIEEIKNGFFFSGKYESRQCVFNIPHVFVFANNEPDYEILNEDRWNVVLITN